MSFFALILLSQSATPSAILDRYAAFRKANPALSVDWSLTRGETFVAKGSLAVQGRKRLLFKATNGVESYSCSETELGGVELIPSQQVYDEMTPFGTIYLPQSRVSSASKFFPVLLVGDRIDLPGIKPKYDGKMTVAGQPSDLVSWGVETQMGIVKFQVGIDGAGRMTRLVRETGGGMAMKPVRNGESGSAPEEKAGAAMTWTMSNYRVLAKPTLATFLTPIPKGYVPHSVPSSSDVAIGVDGKFPDAKLSNGKASITKGRPSLVLITGPDCAPSRAALADLSRLKSQLAGTTVRAVSLAGSRAEALGLPFDPTGRFAHAVGDTATPLFVLVDAKGKISNLWTGYDASEEVLLAKEIKQAVKIASSDPQPK